MNKEQMKPRRWAVGITTWIRSQYQWKEQWDLVLRKNLGGKGTDNIQHGFHSRESSCLKSRLTVHRRHSAYAIQNWSYSFLLRPTEWKKCLGLHASEPFLERGLNYHGNVNPFQSGDLQYGRCSECITNKLLLLSS